MIHRGARTAATFRVVLLDAALIQNRMHDNVKYDVKSGVVTLTGEVNSQAKRDRAEKVATSVPNVKQVVNDLQVKNPQCHRSCGVSPIYPLA